MGTTIRVFHQQFRASIEGGNTYPHILTSILSSLGHLDPFRVMNSGNLGFMWITQILNSGYPEEERYQMASTVVRLLGKEVDSHPPKYFVYGWISPLLDFLSLGEKFYAVESPPGFYCSAQDMLISDQQFCLYSHRHYSQPTPYNHAVWLSSSSMDSCPGGSLRR